MGFPALRGPNYYNTLEEIKKDDKFIQILYSLPAFKYKALLYMVIEGKNISQVTQDIFRYSSRDRVKSLLNKSIEMIRIKIYHLYGINIIPEDVKEIILAHQDKLLWVIKKEVYVLDKISAEKNIGWTLDKALHRIPDQPKLGDSIKVDEKVLKLDIDTLEISARAFNNLKKANINTIEELLKCSELDLYKMQNMGAKSIKQILSSLQLYNIS